MEKQLKAFMKIFDSDVQKAFQRGSMFTKRFEDSANVRYSGSTRTARLMKSINEKNIKKCSWYLDNYNR